MALDARHILFIDEHVLAVDKPAGLPCDQTLDPRRDHLRAWVSRWAEARGEATPGLLHRLDLDTTGVVLFGRTKAARRALTDAFREAQVEKRYLALVATRDLDPRRTTWEVESYLGEAERVGKKVRMGAVRRGGKRAHTRFRVLGALERDGIDASIVEAQPTTGRRHQIRAHLAEAGAPILGDMLYGGADRAPRTWLHARSIAFAHPLEPRRVRIVAPLPRDWPQRAATEALDSAG